MNKKKVILGITGIVVILMVGIGAYLFINHSSSSQTSSDQSAATSYSAKKDQNSQVSSPSQSSSSVVSSDSVNSSSVSSETSSVDLKNLTNAQAVAWMKANMGSVLADFNSTENKATNNNTTFNANDFSYEYEGNSGGWDGSSDDSVYYSVHENHSSANMQHAGADQDSHPMVCWFRITGNGELQLQSTPDGGWQTVSTSYNG